MNLAHTFPPSGITKDVYDRKHTEIVNRQHEINRLLESHHDGNEHFKIALTSLMALDSKSYELFESSTLEEKRQLIGYVFSNLELKGRKLSYTLKTPFNYFVDLASCKEWLPIIDTIRTHAMQDVLLLFQAQPTFFMAHS